MSSLPSLFVTAGRLDTVCNGIQFRLSRNELSMLGQCIDQHPFDRRTDYRCICDTLDDGIRARRVPLTIPQWRQLLRETGMSFSFRFAAVLVMKQPYG